KDPVQRAGAHDAAGTGPHRRRQIGRAAEDRGDVSAMPPLAANSANKVHRSLSGRLVVATHNPGKLREMRELLAPYRVEAVSAAELGLEEPAESGRSFGENARIKATAATH